MRSMPALPPLARRLWAHGLLLAILFGSVLALQGTVRAEEDPKKDGDPNAAQADADKKEPEPQKRTALLPQLRENARDYKELIEAARQYFDLEEELWRGRVAFLGELEKQAAEGRWFLKDMDALRWLVQQGRSFLPPLTDRKWQRDHEITEYKKLGPSQYHLKSEDLTIFFNVPRDYPDERDFRKIPRDDPLPLLLTLHRKGDYTGQKYPGEVLMKRLYGDKKIWEPLYEDWLVLAPIAAAGNFADDGKPRPEVFLDPFSRFWKHYHVDFERIVLDGEDAAFAIATTMPVFFAGIVLRGDFKLTDEQKAQVKNFASIPVFVVDNPALAKELEDAGHKSVTKGIANAQLMKWMADRKRVLPRSFEWSAARTDQVLPYWINLDAPNWDAAKRELKVEVVDTEKEPNTIKVDAIGIDDMSFFLNDEIVDLDRPVRLVINGHIEHDGMVKLQDEKMAPVGRDFDYLFKREPLIIRDSMCFGWLTPERIVRVQVRDPEKKEEPKGAPEPTGPKASAEDEEKAKRYMVKARKFMEAGNTSGAIEYLDKVLELPTNEQTDEARTLRAKLQGDEKSGK